ncbi:hypothetical protein ACFOOK_20945 [Micromonospora krabiensis]|uniref:Tryptophan-associated transmembrane protein (Trp_oprn_chp) n=1 Tax=Micromonospora krabiensis TaxID=307121 RepID=A0A1C3N8P2_9ACTN|nr:hypothetical protein [Micromonospora krabiensis]SBV28964.1 hypothetical protein GA0070620_4523 [Micromonospora krabiensis]
MSRELPIPRQDDRSDGTAVVEWGAAEPGPAPRPGRSLAGLARDRRVPPLLAGLGAVAATASLAGEWLVMTIPNGGPTGSSIRVPAGLAEIGNLGTGYLVGLLVLVTAVALALRGTRGVRVNARVAGLALAGALLVLLTTTAITLDDAGQRTRLYAPDEGFEIEYGRGLVMAFVACALLGAALWLTTDAGPTDDGDDTPAGPLFRRRGRGPGPAERDDVPPAPTDLTVQPTIPFARPESPI